LNLVEQFNHDINLSDHLRYEKWSNYRKQITLFFKPYFKENNSNHSLLILGAGNCDDLDISFFKSSFKSLTLADIDIESTKKGLMKQHIPIEEVTLVKADFTGHEKVAYFDHFIDELSVLSSTSEIKKYLKQKNQLITDYIFMADNIKLFDTIIISPIYTQLIYNQILNAVLVLKEMGVEQSLLDEISSEALQDMITIIDRFNQNVIRLLKPKGLVFVLSDIFQSRVNEPFYQDIIKSIDSTTKMDHLYEKYVDAYGYGLGDYGIYSMHQHFQNEMHSWLLWPFEDSLHLCVKIVSFQNPKI